MHVCLSVPILYACMFVCLYLHKDGDHLQDCAFPTMAVAGSIHPASAIHTPARGVVIFTPAMAAAIVELAFVIGGVGIFFHAHSVFLVCHKLSDVSTAVAVSQNAHARALLVQDASDVHQGIL